MIRYSSVITRKFSTFSLASIIQYIDLTFKPFNAMIIVIDMFYEQAKAQLLGTKCVFKHHDLHMSSLKLNKYDKFHPLEVVGRGSETQL